MSKHQTLYIKETKNHEICGYTYSQLLGDWNTGKFKIIMYIKEILVCTVDSGQWLALLLYKNVTAELPVILVFIFTQCKFWLVYSLLYKRKTVWYHVPFLKKIVIIQFLHRIRNYKAIVSTI
jgi:hypothetical protein